MLKGKEKLISLMMITIVWIIIFISLNKLFVNLNQALKTNTHQQKKLKEI